MKKIYTFTIAALLMGLVACQKKDGDDKKTGDTPAPTKQEILASKTWILSTMTVSPAWNGKTDMYQMMDPCIKDNTWKFTNDASKTMVIDEGSNICNGNTPKTTKAWSLDQTGSTLTIGTFAYTLKDISPAEFHLLESFDDQGKTYTVTSTYTPK